MYQKSLFLFFVTIIGFAASPFSYAQEWTLTRAIDYAKENNIQVQSQQVSKNLSDIELEQAKASLFPTLSFSSSQGASFSKTASYNDFMEKSDKLNYSGNYSLNSGMTIYAGGRLRNTIRQKEISNLASEYNVAQSKTDIEISVTQAYLQILYAAEALKLAEQAVELSMAQVERSKVLLDAGSISRSDVAVLESQLANDRYQVVSCQNALSTAKLALKQLLELELDSSFEVYFPEIDNNEVLTPIPSLEVVYKTALSELAQIKSSELGIESAELAAEIAKSSLRPTISMNAGISTSSFSTSPETIINQLGNKISESVGVNINIPIFNNKQARSSIGSAKQQILSTKLQDQNIRKQLLNTIEGLHNDAVSAQGKYLAANEQLSAAEISFEIVEEQFNVGLKNSIELISETNNYLNALSSQLQAKFQAVLALKLLNIYQNIPISL